MNKILFMSVKSVVFTKFISKIFFCRVVISSCKINLSHLIYSNPKMVYNVLTRVVRKTPVTGKFGYLDFFWKAEVKLL